MSSLNKIDHFVVLMLENRSFDNILGQLYPASASFDGLTGNEFNPDPNGNPVKVWNAPPDTSKQTMTIPDPDPGELWLDMNVQLFGTPNVPVPPVAPMKGFVDNYLAQEDVAPGNYDPRAIMHFFTPGQVPVISTLAKQFAVSDRWFASAPCQTWPNRFFVHTATANGYQNNMPLHLPYEMTTIYNRFELAGNENWKIYFHDIPQSKTLAKLWPLASHFHFFNSFLDDARLGTLPTYSFIEPRYFPLFTSLPNDQHPPHNVTLGEQLIADIYNALRSSPQWTKTLFIITYDEHGGCYDHAAPPAATPPSKTPTAPFNFDRFGVRVPAVLVSPYIKQGTILRPPGNTPYDHTSIIATLRERFPDLGAPLTDRDAAAPDLAGVLTLANPDNLGPEQINALPYTPTPAEAALAQAQPLNGMQEALTHLAANLPNTTGADFQAAVANHIAQLKLFGAKPLPGNANTDHASSSAAFVRERMGDFFRGLDQP
jgi:phospholipase C